MNRIQKAAMDRNRVKKQAPQLADLIGDMTRAKTEGKDPYTIPPHLRQTPVTSTTPSGRSKSKSQPENKVIQACFCWLKNHGIFVYRQNTGCAWIGDRPIRYGLPGSADITGLMPDGRRLEVEVKSAKGRQSDLQKWFQELIEANNGIYILAYSEQDVEDRLKHEGYSFDK